MVVEAAAVVADHFAECFVLNLVKAAKKFLDVHVFYACLLCRGIQRRRVGRVMLSVVRLYRELVNHRLKRACVKR